MRLTIVTLSMLLLSSCTLLPGMENMHTFGMSPYSHRVPVQPLIIPINTAAFDKDNFVKQAYIVASPDSLNITVWKHPEFDPPAIQTTTNNQVTNLFSNQFNYTVSSSGNLYFPLIGNVHVAGKTVEEIRLLMTERLKTYIRHPHVIVKVAEYRSKKIYILGEVIKPGLLYLNDEPMSLIDAITLSGSVDPNTGDPRYIYVIRGNPICPKIYWLNANTANLMLFAQHFQMRNDDIIYVSTAIVTRWNRFLSQLLPTLQTIWYTKAITRK